MNLQSVALFVAIWGYKFASFGTFAYLTARDAPDFNWWNWALIIPINIFLGSIWPIYWGILHWIFPL